MRKIAANYILLPGFGLVRNGYVMVDGDRVVDVVDTGGKIQEVSCLEFYGGMIVADTVRENIAWEKGDDLRDRITTLYEVIKNDWRGLALIRGADLCDFKWLAATRIERLR